MRKNTGLPPDIEKHLPMPKPNAAPGRVSVTDLIEARALALDEWRRRALALQQAADILAQGLSEILAMIGPDTPPELGQSIIHTVQTASEHAKNSLLTA